MDIRKTVCTFLNSLSLLTNWISLKSESFAFIDEFKLSLNERPLNIPILVVGTKADLVKHELTGRQRRYSIIDEFGGDYINLVCIISDFTT